MDESDSVDGGSSKQGTHRAKTGSGVKGEKNVMSQLDAFNRAVTSLHEATLDETLWPAASGLIEAACGSTGTTLVVGKDFGDEVVIFSADICRRGERNFEGGWVYFNVYYPHDERLPRLRRLPDSQVVPVAELFTTEERRTSAVYNQVLRWGGAQNGLNTRLDGPRDSRIVFNLHDPADTTGWGSVQVDIIKALLPHIRHFVNVRWELAKADALTAALADLWSNMKIGVIHLDQMGRIREMNDYARDILSRADGVSERNGFLIAAVPKEHARLERLLKQVLKPDGDAGLGGSMTVSRSLAPHALTLRVSPACGEHAQVAKLPTMAMVLLSESLD